MLRKTFYVSWPVALAFTLLWLLIIAFLFVSRFARTSEGEYNSVTNEQFNFSVTYPSKWRAHTYGEGGFRGQKEARLRIFESQFGSFEILVSHKAAHQPVLEDVAVWGLERIQRANERLQGSDTPKFEAKPLTEDEIAGKRVLRRRYSNGMRDVEEVYIARAEDMIIITLDSDASGTDGLLDEFNQIVESFHPVE